MPKLTPGLIVVGLPTYENKIHVRLNQILLDDQFKGNRPGFMTVTNHTSLLARGFNELWCFALNRRPEATHFLMVHSDIVPQSDFIGILYREMERTKSDILGVVLPIKDERGLTSIAIRERDDPNKLPRRLALAEIERIPKTFSARHAAKLCNGYFKNPILLVNTGLMLVDIRKPWAEKCWFEILDRIIVREDGRLTAETEPEDWHFCRQADQLGAKIMATRIIKTLHYGNIGFPNWGGWGELQDDTIESEQVMRMENAP